ncbi:U4/U6-U5 snRNP complex subunit LSM8 SCDLUD_004464 [Saccharomycodes ludwigii]|uniref:U4/U6-U5 snRNP complex subunit LSM8 n=1 Tax=Saccharomycodes ludwigii TaxID=36035 RepID=UPI001E859D9A|nr:hypothetical protein SCDLUD_004464 [Saccharomycodes ludwigii]KAH3899042.1 hypothetical protein SCDLUD_004464 [Saccharomycodes ludwigii]
MSILLKEYLNEKVMVLTTEGITLLGQLNGYDKNCNITLLHCYICGKTNDNKTHQIIRGSEIVFIALIDKEKKGIEEKDLIIKKLPDTKNRLSNEYVIWGKVWENYKHRR